MWAEAAWTFSLADSIIDWEPELHYSSKEWLAPAPCFQSSCTPSTPRADSLAKTETHTHTSVLALCSQDWTETAHWKGTWPAWEPGVGKWQ